MRRRLIKALGVLVALVAVTAAAAYVYLRRSLPVLDGAVSVGGISAPVEIIRDADAITHVFAAARLDALYGLGYAHAQDRLCQMEFQRRVGYGRLSEIFGPQTVPTDRFLRTVGIGRAARAAWDGLPADARRQLEAYIAGVNAFISTHHGSRLPPEFTILRFEPEPWSGADVLAWVKMMAWDLSRNYSFEIFRHDVLGALGPEKLTDLMPPYPDDGLSILTKRDMELMAGPGVVAQDFSPAGAGRSKDLRYIYDTGRSQDLRRNEGLWSSAFAAGLQDILTRSATQALGSNNWVVDGTMTATGKPLLANDPHLGAQIPSLWYLAHLSAGDFDVIGATLPGAPAVAIGRNRFIAWGETNVMADVEDLYRERIDSTGKLVEFRGAMEPLRVITETIAVKGAAPIHLEVRISRHGPLVSDAINANNAASSGVPKPPPLEPLAFRWTALDPDDTTVAAFLKLNHARNWNEFTAALGDFVVPAQNFVYADADGHIGYYAPGRIPVRAAGDGSAPADGWSGANEWIGWLKFDELPHTFDPPEHFIVTANNRPIPSNLSQILRGEWTEPYRAQRIVDLLRQLGAAEGSARHGRKLTPEAFAAMQADTFSLHAEALVPILLSRVHPQSPRDDEAAAIVRQWNRDARGDSRAAAIFQAWLFELPRVIAGDELGAQLTRDYMTLDRTSYVARFLARTLATVDNPWCDDVRTPKRETCDDAVSAALHAGVIELTARLGDDMAGWRWDAVHRAVFPHLAFDSVNALRPLLSRSVPHGGDWTSVDVGPVFANRAFEQHSIPGYRQIVDLSPANDSRFLDAVGQSGHPLSKHYDDFLQDWRAVRYKRMRMNREEIERGAIGRLRLVPTSK